MLLLSSFSIGSREESPAENYLEEADHLLDMGQDVLIRRPDAKDVSDIHQVMRESRQKSFVDLLPAEVLDWDSDVSDEFREFIHDRLVHEKMALLVATSGKTVVGVAELVWFPDETQEFVDPLEGELTAIHVRPEYWNNGIGTQLLDEAFALSPSRLSGLALSVLKGNERARAFYERRGFEKDGAMTTMFAGEERIETIYRHPL